MKISERLGVVVAVPWKQIIPNSSQVVKNVVGLSNAIRVICGQDIILPKSKQ